MVSLAMQYVQIRFQICLRLQLQWLSLKTKREELILKEERPSNSMEDFFRKLLLLRWIMHYLTHWECPARSTTTAASKPRATHGSLLMLHSLRHFREQLRSAKVPRSLRDPLSPFLQLTTKVQEMEWNKTGTLRNCDLRAVTESDNWKPNLCSIS